MNLVDLAIIIFSLIYAYRGYRIGIVRSVFSLVSIVLSLYISFLFYDDLSKYLDELVSNKYLSITLSFVLIFIFINYLVNKMGDLLEGLLDRLYLGWTNSFLGAIFNFVKGALIIGFILFIVSSLSYNSSFNPLLADSKISPVLLSSFNRLFSFVNKNLPDDILKKWGDYKEGANDLLKF